MTRGIVWRAANHSSAAETRSTITSRLTMNEIEITAVAAVANVDNPPINTNAHVRASDTSFRRPGGAVGMRPRTRHPHETRRQPPGECCEGESTFLPGVPTRAFRRSSGAGRLWTTVARKPHATVNGGATSSIVAREWAALEARDRVVRVSQDPLFLMRRITPVSRCRGAARRWPPRSRLSVSGKGGGHPFAALRLALGAS